ncbi:MAG: AAA family ATP:ADP antiporter [Candidatus Promineifilaceae bacterium]|jgi:AAA family ATP:ADP antiporter
MARLLKQIFPWELSPIQLMCGQAFCAGASLILYVSVAITLFIEAYGANYLPLVFIVSAGVILPLTFGFNQLVKMLPIGQLIHVTLLVIISLFLAFWLLHLIIAWTPLAFGMMVTIFFVTSYLLLVQRMQASQFFDARQMKTRSVTILMSSLAGIILFGLTTRFWLTLLGNPIHLILLASVLLIIMYALGSYTIGQYPLLFSQKRITNGESTHSVKAKSAAVLALLRQPYVSNIFIYQFLSTLGSLLTLYLFLSQAGSFLKQNPDNLTPFLANFLTVSRVVAAGSLVLIVRPLLKRIGISFGLLANPLTVGSLTIALMVALLLFPNQTTIIFWLAAIMMALDIAISFSTSDSTVRTLYQLIPPAERDEIMTMIKGIRIPLSLGFAGVTLLPFTFSQSLNSIFILVYIFLICIVWLASSWQTFKQYEKTLHERLNRRMLDEVDLSLDNAETYSKVEGLIGTGSPPLIRLALNLLKDDEHATYHSRLIGLLNYRNENTLSDVLVRIEEERLENVYLTMTKLFDRHKSSRIKGKILKTISACNPEKSSEFVQTYMDDSDLEIKKGSLVGLIKYGGGPGSVQAGMRLIEIQNNPDTTAQLYTAAILEDVGLPAFYQPILSQLDHPESRVRNGALKAATKVVHPSLLNGILKNLEDQKSRSAAMDALLAHQDYLLPAVQNLLSIKNHDIHRQVKARITRTLGKLKTDEALDILYQNIGHPDIVVRSATLTALRNSRFQAQGDEEKEVVEDQILAELLDAVYLVAVQRDIGTGIEMSTLNTALQIELINIRNRLFNLLSFIYDRNTIWMALSHVGSNEERERTIALETLDIILAEKHKQQISAVIDNTDSPEMRIEALRQWLTIPEPQSAPARIRTLINSDQTRGWTQASAVYSAAQSGFHELIPDIKIVRVSDHPIVAETAHWAIQYLSNSSSEQAVDQDKSEKNNMITIEKVAILKAASIFNDTPDNVLASVAAIVKEVPLEAHVTFIKQGDLSQEMYLIVEGEVAALINGKQIITLGQGQTVGELGIFNQEPRSADVKTLTPSLLFSIEREALNELMADRPEIAQGIIGALSRRVREQGRLMSQSAS